VTNSASAPVIFYGESATGSFSAGAGSCPVAGGSLAVNASCTLSVTFTPTAPGMATGTLSLSTSASPQPITVALYGTALAATLAVAPGSLSFGSITVGASSLLSVTLTDTGTAPVTTISTTVTGVNAADFAVTTPCPMTLQPGTSCTAVVTFTPSGTGGRMASLVVSSSDPSGPAVLPVTGTGVAGVGSFVLTVNGQGSATATVSSGSPATFPLLVTPVNGFAGTVAITCTGVDPGQYATCSITPSQLTITGGVQSSTATINTITKLAGSVRAGMLLGFGALPLLAAGPRRRRRRCLRLAAFVAAAVLGAWMTGCGGKSGASSSGGGGGTSSTLNTPAGTYQYMVTATSTSGPTITSSVTLNLIVQ
jgi:hypothetical protein